MTVPHVEVDDDADCSADDDFDNQFVCVNVKDDRYDDDDNNVVDGDNVVDDEQHRHAGHHA
jgi:hypothetical protein